MALAGAVAVVLPLALTASGPRAANAAQASGAVPAADSPAGFYYGTDSWPIAINSKAPYREPVLSSHPVYGGYIGMAGNWARWSGCGGNIAWSSADSAAANTNYNKYGRGIGTGVYWFMGGPGVDPNYNGTTGEASSWGAAQAAKTLRAMASLKVTYKIVWLDIELPGIKPALDNGWNNVYTSPCSGRIKTVGVPAAVDRAEVNGYEAYLTAHSSMSRASTRPRRSGAPSSAPAAPRIFPAPMSGRTPTPPAGSPSPRSSGASSARPPAPGSSAA